MIEVRSIADGTVVQLTIAPSVSREAALDALASELARMPGVVATAGASVAHRDGATVVEIPCVGPIVERVAAPPPVVVEPDATVRTSPSARRPRSE